MYTNLTYVLAVAGLALGSADVAMSQNPVRLPGVQVTAPIAQPGPNALVGIVRDTFALPIDRAEVSIIDLKQRVFTGADSSASLLVQRATGPVFRQHRATGLR